MKHRVLVVDDELTVRCLLADILQKSGFSVITAESCEEGRRIVEDEPIQLVVLDISFPDGDGIEALGQIKATHPDLPVIMLTGLAFDKDLMDAALARGATGYISKLLPASELIMEIRRVLKQVE